MTTETPALARGSANLLWTLVARSFGLAAGIAVALLLIAAIAGAF